MKHLAFFVVALAAAPAHALEPGDFAWGWPLSVPGKGGAFQIELPPEVHAVLVTDDQRDLAVFDARGRPVAFDRYTPPPRKPAERRVALPVFPLPRDASGDLVDARLQVERAPDGSLRRLEAGLVGVGGEAKHFPDHLLDASRIEDPIDALVLHWTAEGDVRARFAVEASEDLEHWRTLVGGATVLALRDAGQILERRRIELPVVRPRYLRLRALEAADLGALSVEAAIAEGAPTPALRWIEARLVEAKADGTSVWETQGSFDVAAVRVVPQGERSISELLVRSESGGTFVQRARLTLVRVQSADETLLRNEAEVAPGPRARRWQLLADPPLDVPPRLLFGTRPDRFAFLAEGEGPWLLAAGSGSARREDVPMQAALEAIARRKGSGWQPPQAILGARTTLGGEAALDPAPAEIPWTTIALWSVLVGGALLVLALALRMLRTRPRDVAG